MLPILAAILAFITIGSLGWVLVGGEDSSAAAVKRAKGIAGEGAAKAARRANAAAANTPEMRRKQLLLQLKDIERRDRKARLTMASKLKQAGLSLSMRGFTIISVVTGFVGLFLAFVLGAPFLASLGIGVVAGLGLPRWVVGFIGKRRMKQFSGEFANAIDVIVRGIKSGLPIHDCFKIIARESPAPLGPEFQRLVEGLGVGLTLGDALDKMFERMPTPELKFFAIVIAIQQKSGGNLAEALGNLSSVLRGRKMMAEKIKALSSEAIASSFIIGSLPPLVMVVVTMANPEYMTLMFTDPRGQVMLLGAATWMTLGILVMRRMIAFKI